jgi:hypothetical protein
VQAVRFIPTRVHGVLDYLTAIALIAMPWVLGLRGGLAFWLPVVLGVAVIVYSVLTSCELALVRVISMAVHLGLDIAGGLLLAISPWLFGFDELTRIPYLAVGIFEIAVALVSQTVPGRSHGSAAGHIA